MVTPMKVPRAQRDKMQRDSKTDPNTLIIHGASESRTSQDIPLIIAVWLSQIFLGSSGSKSLLSPYSEDKKRVHFTNDFLSTWTYENGNCEPKRCGDGAVVARASVNPDKV